MRDNVRDNMRENKKVFYTEIGYIIGLVFTAIGVALMIKANLGVSMIVAPTVLIQQKLSEFLPWITVGQVEWVFQGLLLILMSIIVRRFRASYLFSVVTVLIYTSMLDGMLFVLGFVPNDILAVQIVLFLLGWLILDTGLSFMFRTYIAPEVYELFVREVTDRYKLKLSVVKTVYDMSSLTLAIILSFALFGCFRFDVIFVGTVVNALLNGFIIGKISKFFDKRFEFRDKFDLRNK